MCKTTYNNWSLWGSPDMPISKWLEIVAAYGTINDSFNYCLKQHLHFAIRDDGVLIFLYLLQVASIQIYLLFPCVPSERWRYIVLGLSVQSSDLLYLHLLIGWYHPVSCTIYKLKARKLVSLANLFIWTINSHPNICCTFWLESLLNKL